VMGVMNEGEDGVVEVEVGYGIVEVEVGDEAGRCVLLTSLTTRASEEGHLWCRGKNLRCVYAFLIITHSSFVSA